MVSIPSGARTVWYQPCRGQREDAPGLGHPVRGSSKNRWNKWHTPQASQGRAGWKRGTRTEGKQLHTPAKR